MTRARTNRHASCTETRSSTSGRIDIYDPSVRIFHERAGPRSVDRQYFSREISKNDRRRRRNVSLSFLHSLYSFRPYALSFFPFFSPLSFTRLRSKRYWFPGYFYNSRLITWRIFNFINPIVSSTRSFGKMNIKSARFSIVFLRIRPLFPLLFPILWFSPVSSGIAWINFNRVKGWKKGGMKEEGEEEERLRKNESAGWLLTEFCKIKRGMEEFRYLITYRSSSCKNSRTL